MFVNLCGTYVDAFDVSAVFPSGPELEDVATVLLTNGHLLEIDMPAFEAVQAINQVRLMDAESLRRLMGK